MLDQRKEYSRYYGDFRGVDFSNDHTLVSDHRFPYAVNMYKDYMSGGGQGIETIPGFRRRFEAPNRGRIYGIHKYRDKNGDIKVLVHAGDTLYAWHSFGEPGEEPGKERIYELFIGMQERDSVSFVFNNKIYIIDGKNYLVSDGMAVSKVKDDAYIPTTYINIIPEGENADIGTEYEQRNMLTPRFKHTFIADGSTTVFKMNERDLDAVKSVKVYGNIIEDFVADVKSGTVKLAEAPKKPEEAGYPEFYAGVEIEAEKAVYEVKDVKIPKADGTFTTLAAYRSDNGDNGDDSKKFVSMIEKATVVAVFDNRVFFSGIDGKPNLILYCERNSTGHTDPSYIGILNYMEDGIGTTPITAMIPVANTLLVLKGNTLQDGSVYYHTPTETGIDIVPKIYPSESGLAGTGCMGAACNFLDDPVFISPLGLDAIGQLSVRYERAREHRSSMIDAKLVNVPNLASAKMCEWGGYLLVLVDGKIFMADSRKVFQNENGNIEYEWYYLEDIGVYEGQWDKYYYLKSWPNVFKDENGDRIEIHPFGDDDDTIISLASDFENPPPMPMDKEPDVRSGTVSVKDQEDNDTYYEYLVQKYISPNGDQYAFLCDTTGEKIGGTFKPAVCIQTILDGGKDNVFFGTENGVVCSFNFDKRDENGIIDRMWYTFDDRTIYCGCAMKMDNCGIPHMTKTTVKRSTVIKTKSAEGSSAKVRVRTNENPYHEIARINSSDFSFSSLNFSDFSFVTEGDTLFSIKEKEKKWVEKQYYIYSDEFKKPFSIYYVAHKYYVAGKYKN